MRIFPCFFLQNVHESFDKVRDGFSVYKAWVNKELFNIIFLYFDQNLHVLNMCIFLFYLQAVVPKRSGGVARRTILWLVPDTVVYPPSICDHRQEIWGNRHRQLISLLSINHLWIYFFLFFTLSGMILPSFIITIP